MRRPRGLLDFLLAAPPPTLSVRHIPVPPPTPHPQWMCIIVANNIVSSIYTYTPRIVLSSSPRPRNHISRPTAPCARSFFSTTAPSPTLTQQLYPPHCLHSTYVEARGARLNVPPPTIIFTDRPHLFCTTEID